MELIHYSNDEAVVVESRDQDLVPSFKPRGLWVSDESDETSWSAWCASEEYGIGRNAFRVELAPDANVLTLTTVDAVRSFHREWKISDGYYLAWAAIAFAYQGIIISPYQWTLRLDREVNWYYPWDCASGCIWDAEAVASVTPLAEAVSS